MSNPRPLTEESARRFAEQWIDAWNRHDLEAILTHYADEIVFTSPFITELLNEPLGTLQGKAALRAYFSRALHAYPELNFELYRVFTGIDSMVIRYRSVYDLQAAEVMRLSVEGKIVRAEVYYAGTIRVERMLKNAGGSLSREPPAGA